jgi:hypothetical protein
MIKTLTIKYLFLKEEAILPQILELYRHLKTVLFPEIPIPLLKVKPVSEKEKND